MTYRIPACRLIMSGALLLLGVAGLHAQTVYRIVGPDGKVTFSDKPPAESANASARTAAGKPASAPRSDGNNSLPYELRQVVAKYPVTLYASAGCAPCTSGRLMLQARGIPFTEYLVASANDVEALQRLSGASSLPLLTIGGQRIKGYSEAEWTQFLNAANYPAASKLPATYRNPEPKPLVSAEKAAVPAGEGVARGDLVDEPTQPAAEAPPPAVLPPSNPAGIKF